MQDTGPYGFPGARPWDPGKPSLQVMSEALDRQEERCEWDKNHPGDVMPEQDWQQVSRDYAAIERGQNLFGAMTFEPGDALRPKGE